MAKGTKAEPGANRIPLMVRTSPAFREQLEAAAKESGRSLAQEAELRLERSFELVSMINAMAKSNGEMAAKMVSEYVDITEKHMLELGGGDDLFMVWSRLSWIIHSVENETGKSIREDDFTRNKAEREVLGSIPDIFRNLPDSFSSFREKSAKRARGELPADGLLSLGRLMGSFPPLGHVGPWPPEQE